MSLLLNLRYAVLVLPLLYLPIVAHAEINLRFAWWGAANRHEQMLKAIRLFEQQNPGVRIRPEYMTFGAYLDRLSAQMVVGKEPDLMLLNWSWLSLLSPSGENFYDLYKIRKLLKLEEYPKESYKAGLVHGKLNGLNLGQNGRVFLWQKNTFEKAGIAIPRNWDELLTAGRTFEKKLGKDFYPLQLGPHDVFLLSHVYLMQRTGKPYIYPDQAKVALTEEDALEWVRFYQRLLTNHVTKFITQKNDEVLGEFNPAWIAGSHAGLYTWLNLISPRVATLPKTVKTEVGSFITMPGAKNSGMFSRPTAMLAVSKHSQYPEIAAKLATFLLTDAAAVKLMYPSFVFSQTQTGYSAIKDRVSVQEQRAFEQINSLSSEYPSPLFEHPQLQAFVQDVFESVMLGQIEEKEAARSLVQEGNKLLRTLR